MMRLFSSLPGRFALNPVSAGLAKKLLKLKRPVAERFYALYREQFNPISRYTARSLENGFPVGTLRAKRYYRQPATGRQCDVCRKSPSLVIKVHLTPRPACLADATSRPA